MTLNDILKPEFIWWKDLTEDEKKVIQDPSEYPIFSVIHGIPKEIRKEIYNSMRVKDKYSGIYSHTEAGWIDFFEKCFYSNNGIDPTELKEENSPRLNEVVSREVHEFLDSALHETFRLYFAVKFRDEMDVLSFNDKTETFFFQVGYHLKENSK